MKFLPILLTLLSVFLCTPACSGSAGDSRDAAADAAQPPFEGECGLIGQRVWCNEDYDCVQQFNNACDLYGNCWHSTMGMYECAGTFGDPCALPNTYCNATGMCSNLCETHDDCPDGSCACRGDTSVCSYWRCVDGACPQGTEPVASSLACATLPEVLQGECHTVIGADCPPGYEPVDDYGCTRVSQQ